MGMDTVVAIAVESLQGHDAEKVGLIAQGVDSGQSAAAIDGCLAVEGEMMVLIAIVETGIQEMLALGIIETIVFLGIGTEAAVEAGVNGIGPQAQTFVAIVDGGTQVGLMGIVLLL